VGWVKLDDGFPMHPKVVQLSFEARWAFIESLCYAARYQTDGVIPDAVAANGSVRAELLASGLWERLENSVSVHDYLDWNLSRRQARALSKARSKAGAKGGAKAQAKTQQRDGSKTGTGLGVRGGGPGEGTADFDAFWAMFPRKVGKPKARTAFNQALRRASLEDILAGAKRYAEDPNRSDEFTAHPTTWLHRDGWNDDPLPPRGRKEPTEHPLDAMARRHLEGVSHADLADSGGPRPASPRELPGRSG
jgi:hypothetical protein